MQACSNPVITGEGTYFTRWLSYGVLRRVVWPTFQRCLPQPSFLMMDAVIISEMSVSFEQITRRSIPEDSHLRTHRQGTWNHSISEICYFTLLTDTKYHQNTSSFRRQSDRQGYIWSTYSFTSCCMYSTCLCIVLRNSYFPPATRSCMAQRQALAAPVDKITYRALQLYPASF
jgi:hypothetical protein